MSIDIAIVGIAGRFPAALDVEEYWANLAAGTDCITHFAPDELIAAGVPEHVRGHPDFVAAEPRVPEITTMDARLFGLTPREAAHADPQLRLFLECCHASLENAGYDPFATPGRVGVFGATGTPVYLFDHLMRTREPSNQGQFAMLNNGDYLATQVSYRLNLTGPAMTVLTACSSSLVAAHLAARALEVGDCDVALAGGAAVELDAPYGYFYAAGSVRSRDGRCRPFDASGGGTVFGGGAGTVVLKRLADAVADGDHVLAVIRGTAINNDGSDKDGFGAPSVSGQVDCIQRAMQMAGVSPSQLSYVEAHATGTSVGDLIELAALEQAWNALEAGPAAAVPVGSVKSNIGHAAQAAGVAGLIKLVLAFERGLIPPSINVGAPLPRMLEDGCRLTVAAEPIVWERDPERPRTAAISSFGAGGTNVHMVLGEPPVTDPTPLTRRDRVVPWSAQIGAAADALAPVLSDYLAHIPDYEDAVTTQQRCRTPFRVRRAVVLAGPGDAAAPRRDDPALATLSGEVAPGGLALAFAFPGQGSLAPQICRRLYEDEPTFAEHVIAAFELFGPRGKRLADLWRDGTDARELARTGNAQPILFALEWALACTWRDWGVQPDLVIGHSLGEIVAATVAGVFEPEAAAAAVLARADAMQRMPAGAMVAMFATEDLVREQLGEELDLCAVNGEREVVVGGPLDAVAALVQRLRDLSVRVVPLRTSHAFHTRSMREARDEMRDVFTVAAPVAPTIPLLSAAAGRFVVDEARHPDFWADQLVSPVRFRDAVTAMAGYADGAARRRGRLVVELGPGQALTDLVRGHDGARDAGVEAVSLFAPRRAGGAPERREVLTALATAWTRGASVDWPAVDRDLPLRRVPLPGYRYQRQHFWVDIPPWTAGYAAGSALGGQPDATGQPPRTAAEGAPAPAVDVVVPPASPFSVVAWLDAPRPEARLDRPECAVVFLPSDRTAARRVIVALQRCAHHVVAVRPGTDYELSERIAVLDPGEERHLKRLLTELRERGQVPDLVVHATGFERWEQAEADTVDAQLRRGFGSLLRLAQVLSRAGRPPRVVVITAAAVDVSGSETVDPVKAAALGLVRSWPLEDPSVAVRLIDMDMRTGEDDLVDELDVDTGAPVVALRGTRRWSPTEVPFEPMAAHSRLLRRKGVYLVTGGTGALGREVVLGLARTGLQPSIAMLSRSGPSDDPDLAEIVGEAEDLGCRVKVLAGDVTDPREVRRAVDIVTAQLGPLAGVFHLAGVAGDGIVALRDLAAAGRVLAPKVHGTISLHQALRGRVPLDFWVNFSSRASVSGLSGSADYAGANAFLDAWSGAVTQDDTDTRMLSISWPSWAEVGMAAVGLAEAEAAEAEAAEADTAAKSEAADALTYFETLDPVTTWALDEHRLDGAAVLPGAGHVDLVIRGYRQVVGPANAAVRLQDVVFTSALTVSEPVDAEVVFVPEGSGWRFRLQTRRSGTIVHSSGTIEPVPDDVMKRRVDLGLLRESVPAGEPTNRTEQARAFALGPRWNCVAAEVTHEDRTLVDIRIDERFTADLHAHAMHPALLDGSTSSVRTVQDGAYVPFMYGSLVLYEDLPGEYVSSIKRTRHTEDMISADIDLIAPDGSVLAEITDFTMRVFEPGAFAADVADRTASPRRTRATRRGIAPSTGMDLLMRLLDSRTPPHVVVRPFLNGRPEPLAVPAAGRTEPAAPRTPAPRTPAPDAPVTDAGSADAAASPAASDSAGDALTLMRKVWTDVLGAVDLEPDDDFFDVGGTSLSAIEMVSRIRAEFGTELSIATLLESPTMGALAAVVAQS